MSAVESLKFAKPATVSISFDDKDLKPIICSTGEMISSVEISSSFYRPVLLCVLKVKKTLLDNLGLNNIYYSFEGHTVKVSIIPEGSSYTFTRRFMIDEVENSNNSSANGESFLLKCVDVYGNHLLNNIHNVYTSVYKSYPVKNVFNYLQDIFNDLKRYTDQKYKDKELKISIDTEYSGPYSVESKNEDDYLYITHNKPILILREYCLKHNIKIYQDFNGIHIIPSPILSRFPVSNSLLSDRIQNSNPLYIADMNYTKKPDRGISKELYTISVSSGKSQTYKQIDYKSILNSIIINDTKISDYENYLPSKPSYNQGNTNKTIEAMSNIEFYNMLSSRTAVLYLVGNIEDLYPGKLVNINIMKNVPEYNQQMYGENDLNGTWFIIGATYKTILGTDGKFFCRLTLNRFDDPYDPSSYVDTSIIDYSRRFGFSNDLSLSGIIDSFKSVFDDVKNNLKNSVRLFNLSIKNLLTDVEYWFNSMYDSLKDPYEEFKYNIDHINEILDDINDEVKYIRLIYTNNYTKFQNINLSFDELSRFESSLDYTGNFNDKIIELNNTITETNKKIQDIVNTINSNDINKKKSIKEVSQVNLNTERSELKKSIEELKLLREKKLIELQKKQGIN